MKMEKREKEREEKEREEKEREEKEREEKKREEKEREEKKREELKESRNEKKVEKQNYERRLSSLFIQFESLKQENNQMSIDTSNSFFIVVASNKKWLGIKLIPKLPTR